jgi:hypothetical protein
VTTLATLLDLAALTGGTADPTDLKAVRALEAASGLVRAYVGRNLTLQEDDELITHGTGTFALNLPEGPVDEVTLVEEIDNDGTETVIEDTDYRLDPDTCILYRLDQPWCQGIRNYRVTYTHGYTLPGTTNPTLPPEIRATTAQIAARFYHRATQEADDAGRTLTQRSLGSYSESFGSSSSSSDRSSVPFVGMENEEIAILSRYRWGGMA